LDRRPRARPPCPRHAGPSRPSGANSLPRNCARSYGARRSAYRY
jgi:hypothetical protein